jgi:hypothetical protein
VFVCDKYSLSDKTAEIMATPISSSASAATGHGRKSSILPLVSHLYVKGFILSGTPCILNAPIILDIDHTTVSD